jgi:RNA polymerase sigma-70 factor, ECF subfamily
VAGRELIRQLHEASYRRLVIELLGWVDDLPAAEETVREAFAAAYRDGRAVDTALSPHDELRRAAIDVVRRRERRRRLLARLRLRTAGEPVRRPDQRLTPRAQETIDALVALPAGERETAVLSYLADSPDPEIAQALSTATDSVRDLLAGAGAALRADLGPDGGRYRQRLDDLAVELRHAVGLPSFDDVVAVVSRRRRRIAAGVAVGALVVGGGVAFSVARPDDGSAAASADDVPTQTEAVRSALQEPGTSMYAVARNGSGVWASFWFCRNCAMERSFALLSRDGFQHVQVVPLRTDGQGDAWAAPTGDFVVSGGLTGVLQVVSPDGDVHNIEASPSARPRPARPDDLVVTSFGVGNPNGPTVIDTTSRTAWPLRIPAFHDAGAANVVQSEPDGELWGFHLIGQRRSPGVVHSTDGGRHWSSYLFPQKGVEPRTNPFGEVLVGADRSLAFLSVPPGPGYRPELVVVNRRAEIPTRLSPARDVDGRPVQVIGATMGPSGSLLINGADARGVPRVWVAPDGFDDYQSLEPVLREAVTFTRGPLDDPGAVWATAPQAIWQSDDGGRTWDLLISHQVWQNIQVVG